MNQLDLFRTSDSNWLPYDGEVYYTPMLLDQEQSQSNFERLLKAIHWKPDEAIIYGKRIVTSRMTAWYAEDYYTYTYSRVPRTAKLWTPLLASLKEMTENATSQRFNACLLNLYHNGSESLGWHSDDEASLLQGGVIASLSLGAERKFVFKHKQTGEKVELLLETGSLLRMQGSTQLNWLHSLPRMTRVTSPRINLTFRQMRTSVVNQQTSVRDKND